MKRVSYTPLYSPSDRITWHSKTKGAATKTGVIMAVLPPGWSPHDKFPDLVVSDFQVWSSVGWYAPSRAWRYLVKVEQFGLHGRKLLPRYYTPFVARIDEVAEVVNQKVKA